MFWAPTVLNLIMWHAKNRNTNSLVRHATNSKAWAHIDYRWPNFASEHRNVRLRLVTDGFNPYGEKKNSWST
jgi:hypothetical protein